MMLATAAAQFHPQTPEAAAQTARWVANNAIWGYLTTEGDDKKLDSSVASYSDGALGKSTGRFFFYLMGTMKPFVGALTIGESAFAGTCGFAGSKIDPEDPRCAKITLSGSLAKATGADEAAGKAALFARHPQMKTWPASHGFAVYELKLTDLWMIDFYGGGANVTVEEFLKAVPKNNRPKWPPTGASTPLLPRSAARASSNPPPP